MNARSPHLPDPNPGDSTIDVAVHREVEIVSMMPDALNKSVTRGQAGSDRSRVEAAPQTESVYVEPMPHRGNHSLELLETGQNHSPGGSLVTGKRSFGAFLAPLTKDRFKEVVSDVEQKLQVVHQTLSMLDNLMDAQGFDAILEEMLRSITLKTSELLNADRATIYLLDEDKNELWAIVAKDERGNNLELRLPATVGIAGEVATKLEVVNIPYDFY